MSVHVVRSGLPEAEHRVAAAAVGVDGRVIGAWGDAERPFFLRSAAKPFQATVSQEAGAALAPEQLAVAASSHAGHPAHVETVRTMLHEVGLDEGALRCPPAWPRSERAALRLARAGHRRPRRLWHNCSGKHAAMLRACVASGWPVESYLDPAHPLQERALALMAEVTGEELGPPGVDGCGAPIARATVTGLARAFARVVSELRLEEVAVAMHRHPALVSERGALDARLATWLHAVAKGGAEGCLGAGVHGRMGVGVKCWDGSSRGTEAGMVAVLSKLGLLVGEAASRLGVAAPVLGGGRPVGRVESVLE